MEESLAVAVAVIVGVGVGAQWLASALKVPSVLILLPAGVLAGPVLGLVVPGDLFGPALFPLVAIAVGLILFEGGVGLRFDEVREVGRPVLGLVTIGVAITWVVGGITSTVLFGVPAPIGFLLGAILVVSGPTVVLPILGAVRLRKPVAPILRWECIVIDPIGAVLAVALFEAILDTEAGFNPLTSLAASAVVGVGAGAAAGFGLAALLRAHRIPDRLQSSVTLAMVVTCFVAANLLSVEAGLFATTVMGLVLANQRLAPIGHIAAFGEDVGIVVLGGLFIVLGATVDLTAMASVLLPSLALLAVLLAVRPVAVWTSTVGTGLRSNERWYLSIVAPRGVVAASVATLFSVSLQAEGVDGASYLAPAAFVVITGSVLVTSVVVRPAARRLRIKEAEPRGILLAGSQPWLLAVAVTLVRHGVPVLMVPEGPDDTGTTEAGLLSYAGPLDGDGLTEAIDGVGVGVAVVATDGEAASALLVERLSEVLGRQQVYRTPTVVPAASRPLSRSWGRRAFPGLTDQGDDVVLDHIQIVELPAPSRDDFDLEGVVPLLVLRDDAPPLVADRWRRATADGLLIAAQLPPSVPSVERDER